MGSSAPRGAVPPAHLSSESSQRAAGAALRALSLIVVMVVAKLVAGIFIVHSAAMVSEGVHSGVDMFVAALGYVGIRSSSRPPDHSHDFGHGKFEALFALIQGLLILVVGGLVGWSGTSKLIAGSATSNEWVGLAVLGGSTLINLGLAVHLRRVQTRWPSANLRATERDLRADMFASAAVFLALAVVAVTHLQVVDALAALAVAVLVLRASFLILREALVVLLDSSLPLDEREILDELLGRHLEISEVIEFHDVRTRRVGSQRVVEMHAIVPGDITVEEGHRLCDLVEDDIHAAWPETSVTIHVEPPSHRHAVR